MFRGKGRSNFVQEGPQGCVGARIPNKGSCTYVYFINYMILGAWNAWKPFFTFVFVLKITFLSFCPETTWRCSWPARQHILFEPFSRF